MLPYRGNGGYESRSLVLGEDPDTDRPEEAAHWVRIYSELVALHEERLAREAAASRKAVAALKATLEEIHARLEFWRQRHLDLAGIDLDAYARILTAAGRTTRLTRREAQLLEFLMDHPGQYFTSEALIQEAWQDGHLAPEQVRTYVVRLRRKLEAAEVPARLVNRPRVGYSLSVDPGGRPATRRPAS